MSLSYQWNEPLLKPKVKVSESVQRESALTSVDNLLFIGIGKCENHAFLLNPFTNPLHFVSLGTTRRSSHVVNYSSNDHVSLD